MAEERKNNLIRITLKKYEVNKALRTIVIFDNLIFSMITYCNKRIKYACTKSQNISESNAFFHFETLTSKNNVDQ